MMFADELKATFKKEFNFISDLLDKVTLPSEKSDESDSEIENNVSGEEFEEKNKKTKHQSGIKKQKSYFETIERVPEKKQFISLSTRLEEKNLPQPKPVFNSNGNLVFSKFDFLGETSTVTDKEILVKEDTRHIKHDKIEKPAHFKEEIAWKNMFRKVEGIKVKDDPVLLQKSIKKKENKKKSSQKKWKERVKSVEKQKVERQKKRAENISKRIQDKKKKKLKKAAKKGRHIT